MSEVTESIPLKLPLDIVAIQKCIPHQYPFLLIDRVTELTPGERCVAFKNISMTDPHLQGHFPGNPVMPGVLMVEAVAQAAGVLGNFTKEGGLQQCLLTEITSARFRRQVVPGDQLRIEVNVQKSRGAFFWFEARCTVDGDVAAEVTLSAYLK